MQHKRRIAAFAMAGLLATPATLWAQSYPAKPVQMGVAFAGVDVLNLEAATTAQWIERDETNWGALIKAGKISTE